MEKDGCCSYIVSLQKPTIVQFAVIGHFRDSDELDIMLAKVTRIEHLIVTAEGLKPHKEIPIFGRIASMNGFRVPGEEFDSLLVLTAKYHLTILGFDKNGNPRTRAFGHVADKIGRPAETGIITCVHQSGLIGLRLYDGSLKLIQWQEGKELKSFNLNFEDYNVTDVAFMENTDQPTVAYLYQDMNGRHLKVCEIDLEAREFKPALWHQSNIEAEATLLIPIPAPFGGVIVVGQESISYQKNPNHCIAVAPPLINMARFNCFSPIDRSGERFLLGDMSGRLFLLLLLKEMKEGVEEVRDLKIELLGEISIPECLVYLDNSVAFVGSRLGDSQLIRLSTEPVDSDSNSFVTVIETFSNLGPIRDLVLMDVDGQNQLISASGAFKEGSLRIIRSGIGIDEMATIELAGIKAIFTLRVNSELDNYLVLSFADVTHLLLIDKEEMEDTQIANFDLSKLTLWAGNISLNRILQVNPDLVQIISGDGKFHNKWTAPSRLSLAAVNPAGGQIVLSSGAKLFYLRIEEDEFRVVNELECANEIACLDISPLGNSTQSSMLALGFWEATSIAIYSLISDNLLMISEQKLSSEFLPRSILMVTMEGGHFLFVSLGDGTVIHFKIDPEKGSLSDQKKFSLGTQPTVLHKFISKRQTVNVFACSDRPTVIYSNNHKLSFSNVNLRFVNQMSPLNSDVYRDCLALSDGQNLIIGTVDNIQKLHIRTVPLGESVSRIAYQPESRLVAALTSRPEEILLNGVHPMAPRPSISTGASVKSNNVQSTFSSAPFSAGTASLPQQPQYHPEGGWSGGDGQIHSVCFLDSNTFECLYVLELNKNEDGLSIASVHLGDDPYPYFAIGTCMVVQDDPEPKQGRIIIVQATHQSDSSDGTTKIQIVTEKEVKGAVHSITTLRNGNKLICTVNSTVRLFDWTPERELRLECSNFSYIEALYLKTKGDLVLIGDLMRSISLLTYKSVDSSFEEIARDYASEWTTACEIIDSETFFAAETNFNLYCCKIDVNAETDEDRMRLKQVGLYYLGEMVNVFQRGTIVNPQQRDPAKELLFTNPIIYGTADGGLGAIVQVKPHIFEFLSDLQRAIAAKTHNCTRVDHPIYRSFYSEKRMEAACGFVDGDLIESVVEMSKARLDNIVDGLRPRKANGEQETEMPQEEMSEYVLKLVEDLAQIH